MSRRAPRSWWVALAIALAALVPVGCGDDGDGGSRFGSEGGGGGGAGGGDRSDGGSEDSLSTFVENFEHITGVRLQPMRGDLLGTRLQVPAKPNRFIRFGAYQLVYTKDERRRKLLLGRGEADDDGIHWSRSGRSYTASKPFGDRLVLRWLGRREKQTTPQWDRLERAVEAASEGSLDPLPEEERPCPDEDLDPLSGDTGACSLRGIPVTFVEADDDLSVPALEAEVLGFGNAAEIRNPGVAPLRPKGRFLIVAYRVTNKSDAPIRFLQPALRIGGRTMPESPDAAAMLPRSRAFPLPPGASVEARSAFDLDGSVDPRKTALVFPAERQGRMDPTPLLSQGWIRLGKAEPRLPRPPGGRGGAGATGSS